MLEDQQQQLCILNPLKIFINLFSVIMMKKRTKSQVTRQDEDNKTMKEKNGLFQKTINVMQV